MHITFRQLEIFINIMDIGSTAQAAKKLYMSQPAVSTALSELENQLSVKLFDRGNKKLTPNKNGLLFYPKALTLLSHASSVENIFTHQEKKIRFASNELFSTYILPQILAGFSTDYKKISLCSSIQKNDEIIDNIINGRLDIATITQPCSDPMTESIELKKRVVMSVFVASTLAEKILLKNGNDMILVLSSRTSGLRELYDNTMLNYIDNCSSIIELDSIQAIKNTEKLGLGIGCLPLISIEEELKSGCFKEIHRWDSFNFSVVYNKMKELTKEETAFIESICQHKLCCLR